MRRPISSNAGARRSASKLALQRTHCVTGGTSVCDNLGEETREFNLGALREDRAFNEFLHKSHWGKICVQKLGGQGGEEIMDLD